MAYSAAACTHKPGSNAGNVEPLTSFHGAYSVVGSAGTDACTNKPGILVLTLTFFPIAAMALQIVAALLAMSSLSPAVMALTALLVLLELLLAPTSLAFW